MSFSYIVISLVMICGDKILFVFVTKEGISSVRRKDLFNCCNHLHEMEFWSAFLSVVGD